jgi:hypothetical protein
MTEHAVGALVGSYLEEAKNATPMKGVAANF